MQKEDNNGNFESFLCNTHFIWIVYLILTIILFGTIFIPILLMLMLRLKKDEVSDYKAVNCKATIAQLKRSQLH